MENCPICGQPLDSQKDLIIVRYYAPKKWWVTYHLKKSLGDEALISDGILKDYKSWCAQANFARVSFSEGEDLTNLNNSAKVISS